MNKKDYYEILQVTRNETAVNIKKSYRKLAHKYHPDRNSAEDAVSKFKEVSEAYEILSDPQKKEQYDIFGHNTPRSSNWGAHENPFDMFNSFFSGNQKQSMSRDIRVDLIVSLEEVLSGSKKQITYMQHLKCTTCNGAGGTGNGCRICDGCGKVEQSNGFIKFVSVCPHCHGSGIQITKKCSKCKGKCEVGTQKTITINIPPGVNTGNQVRISGGGDQININSIPGNLLCRINVEPHEIFQRDDKNIQCIQEISFVDACLGIKVMIPTLGGEQEELVIPKGTQFGQSFCIKGKGVPGPRSRRRGDQYVKIHINVPKKLTSEEKNILKKFDKKIKGKT